MSELLEDVAAAVHLLESLDQRDPHIAGGVFPERREQQLDRRKWKGRRLRLPHVTIVTRDARVLQPHVGEHG